MEGDRSVTLWDLLAAVRRHRWAAAVVAVATAVVALYGSLAPGVYHQQVDVVFEWPQGARTSNAFLYGEQTLISTAGVIARIVDEPRSAAHPVSDSVTLVGEGITRGHVVRLPNAGGQWALNFDRPVLDVQVAGNSPDEVRATMARVLAQIDKELRDQQQAEGVPASVMIRTRLSPAVPFVEYSKGSRVRAVAATFVLGFGLTVGAVMALEGGDRAVDSVAHRKRSRRRLTSGLVGRLPLPRGVQARRRL
jgi:uncharacterized protein involved in exopolysaccharide biosynthesis